FSVPDGIPPPPSLKNIFLELEKDLQISKPKTGNLISWAKQGVLLLNSALTVRKDEPGSHSGQGWEQFTDAVIQKLVERKEPIVFLLWGRWAQEKCKQIIKENHGHHCILLAAHPSPFSAHRGFLGCRHFSQTNQILLKNGQTPIDWGKQ
ncbi:MAG TPA: uracil-DNA glycosylase, partial [Rhabdochlamydiaceae bacterium]|nr:uracil-DNA glycosylase [Rhabdochlamydiaceae bacterium]